MTWLPFYMLNYWDLLFKNEGALWKFEPSDSALYAAKLFYTNNIKNILIPGIGYGRNAQPFIDKGCKITGIEISQYAIDLAREHKFTFPVFKGSVTDMPFESACYEGIFCYALLHLLNKKERKKFINDCYNQLVIGGLLVFAVISTESEMFGTGRYLSKNRYQLPNKTKVYFYNKQSLFTEFSQFSVIEINNLPEPIKFAEGFDPLKFIIITCKKEK